MALNPLSTQANFVGPMPRYDATFKVAPNVIPKAKVTPYIAPKAPAPVTKAAVTTTNTPTNNTPQQSFVQQPPQDTGPSPEELYAQQVRGDINSSYDQYFANLDQQLNSLPGQAESQNQIIANSYNQGVGDLNLQQQQGLNQFGQQRTDVTTNQNKNLRSLDENLRNLFMAGNVYLGSRGAGDSSAANQYAYALTKQGTQARGDQMSQATQALSQIQARETNLLDVVNNEKRRLDTEKSNNLLQVSQWLAEAQNKVKSAVASGQLARGTDLANLSKSLYDQAIQRLNTIQQQNAQQQANLMTWAQNNSKTLGELKSNLQGIMSIQPNLPGATQVNGQISTDSRGNATMTPLFGYSAGSTDNTKKGLFGF